jgi:dienelactone hydrolase
MRRTPPSHTLHLGHRVFGGKVREFGRVWAQEVHPRAPADNARMEKLIRNATHACAALLVAAAAMVAMAAAAAPPASSPVQTQVHALDGHRVTLDVYPAAGPPRGAAILSHGFTRSRRTLAGHAQALADAGVLALTPDLPCTFDFRCNARALAALVGSLRAGGTFGAAVERVMLVGFSAGGLSSLLAADTPGVVGFVGLDPFDRTMPDEAGWLGLAAAGQLRTEALLMRAPPSRCNAESVAAPWGAVLPALWRDELIAGASHCDFESPTDWMCRLACGDTDPPRQQRVRQGLLDAASRWMR